MSTAPSLANAAARARAGVSPVARTPAHNTAGPQARAPAQTEERAYVLHTYPYSETSLIVEMFTRSSGRVPLIAKGAKRSRSNSAALMQFQPFNIVWSGRGDLRTLKKFEWQGGVPTLPPARLFCGFYLNELMLKLLARDDAHEHLFDCYENALARLASDAAESAVLRSFEKSMLRETGYALMLTLDAFSGEGVRAGERYTYIPERGPRLLEGSQSSALEMCGQTLLDIEADNFAHPRTAAEAKLLMRMLVTHQMNGRPLATRQIFSQVLEL